MFSASLLDQNDVSKAGGEILMSLECETRRDARHEVLMMSQFGSLKRECLGWPQFSVALIENGLPLICHLGSLNMSSQSLKHSGGLEFLSTFDLGEH